MKRVSMKGCVDVLRNSRLNQGKRTRARKMSFTEFVNLMHTVSDGWNEGDARKASNCYAEDTVYSEPPDKQLFKSREALFEFFGGEQKPEPAMQMKWHHLAFNEKEQVGFGEYTYQGNNRFHGIVIVKVQDGKIRNWREYQYKSNLNWKQFIGINNF
jgi:ketosteroid isomerase-like protein